MGNSIRSIEFFTCLNCGMNYTATKERHHHSHSGRFECKVCSREVHAWSGLDEFYGWKVESS
ncbi:MAG TPA: hypothetical protein VGL45_14915, partial [Bradyrhizobium sp.]